MKDLLEYLVKSLVAHSDQVAITEENSDDGITLTLSVHPDDTGIVIGKGGQTIRAIRKLLIARAMAEGNMRVNLKLDGSSTASVKE